MAAQLSRCTLSQGTRCPLASRPVSRPCAVSAKATSQDAVSKAMKSVALAGVAGQMFMAGQASAAQEVAMMAGDNRTGILLTLFAPVVAWVAFNIGGPALNQVNSMDAKKGLIGAVGLGAGLLATAGSAEAAQEVAAVAGDNRLGILLFLFAPVVGWVLFNIGGPALNQVDKMGGKKKALIGGAGLGAALLAGGSAEAAQEVAAVAGDNRLGLLLFLFAPVVGWVLFNIGGPALNQVDKMGGKAKALVGGAGVGAALLAGGSAEAAQEVAAVAGDNRLGILLFLFAPVVGWVLFNIGGPALNQVDKMGGKK